MQQLQKTLKVVFLLISFSLVGAISACSPSSSNGGGGGNNPKGAPPASKIEAVTKISSQDYFSATSKASKVFCPQGFDSMDKEAVQGMTLVRWSSSASAVRHETSTTNSVLTLLSPNKVVWEMKLVNAEFSDFTGALPIGLPVTMTHTKTTENNQTRWNSQLDLGNMSQESLDYLKNRKPDVDSAPENCQYKMQGQNPAGPTYSTVSFTLSSGKKVAAFQTDDIQKLSIVCPGQPNLELIQESQSISSAQVLGEFVHQCIPMTQLRRSTITKDLKGNVLKTELEEVLDSNLRKVQ